MAPPADLGDRDLPVLRNTAYLTIELPQIKQIQTFKEWIDGTHGSASQQSPLIGGGGHDSHWIAEPLTPSAAFKA